MNRLALAFALALLALPACKKDGDEAAPAATAVAAKPAEGEWEYTCSATVTRAEPHQQETVKARSEIGEDDACAQAYKQACARLGGETGCEKAAGFTDNGGGRGKQKKGAVRIE